MTDQPQQQWLLAEDQQRRLDLSQFYTPSHLAERMWEWASRPGRPHERVCEPSAGRGSLILPMYGRNCPSELVAYDVDPLNVKRLNMIATVTDASRTQAEATVNAAEGWAGESIPMRRPAHPKLEVRARDFCADLDPGRFDLVVMNPPYENNQDVEHIDHALNHAPLAIVLVRSAIVHGQGRFRNFWRHVDIRRRANLVERPEFSVPVDGKVPPGAKSDFVVLDLERRQRARRQGEVSTQSEEWWSWAA